MITDFLFNSITIVPKALLSLLPDMAISIPDGVFNWILDIARAVGYLLPIKSLLAILGMSLSIRGFQIVWALILRVKSFIPTMGN